MWGGQRLGAPQPGLRLSPVFAARSAAIHQRAAEGAATGGASAAAPVAGIATWKPLNGSSIAAAVPPVVTGSTGSNGAASVVTADLGSAVGASGANAQPSEPPKKKKKKKNSKFVGSCGIYLVAVDPYGNNCQGVLWVLVHRRSKQVFEANTLASPGGIVEKEHCGPDGTSFEVGARTTAVKELLEETGVQLSGEQVEALLILPVGGDCHWGEEQHRNYCAVVKERPKVPGPEKASVHEMIKGGTEGIGQPSGDGFNAWIPVDELLSRTDVMPQCRVPLQAIQDLKEQLVEECIADQ